MSLDPNDYKYTHDSLGREFTEPQSGGPVPGKVNVTIGLDKGYCLLVCIQQDDREQTLYGPSYESDPGEEAIQEEFEDLLSQLEPYDSDQPYWHWYFTYVGDLDFDKVVQLATDLLPIED